MSGNLGWKTGHDHMTTFLASTRPEVDHPIRLNDNAHVVLDDHDRIAGIDKLLKVSHQAVGIGGMQARSGFIQHIKRPATSGALQFSRQLDAALRLTVSGGHAPLS